MLQIRRETEGDIQTRDLDPFVVYVVYIDGVKVFSTEEGEYLKASSHTLVHVGETVILEADRNEQEYDGIGPSHLLIERTVSGYRLLLAEGLVDRTKRKAVIEVAESEWRAMLSHLQ